MRLNDVVLKLTLVSGIALASAGCVTDTGRGYGNNNPAALLGGVISTVYGVVAAPLEPIQKVGQREGYVTPAQRDRDRAAVIFEELNK